MRELPLKKMAKIADKYIRMLREQGLFVAEPMPSGHVYPDGVLVGKPTEVEGNFIPGYTTGYGIDAGIEFNAPPVWLYCHCDVWVVLAEEFCPGPGPGDFVDEWNSPEEAVQDILEFYFGDPKRMQAKAEARKRAIK